MDYFFNSLLNLLQHCFCCFMFWFFGLKVSKNLVPQSGIETALLAVKGGSLDH